jgi:protein-L-isoaspartate(D-aspartate) O-methyltransferase
MMLSAEREEPMNERGEGAKTLAFLLSLRAQGVHDLGILRAMERVPRDHFAPRRYSDLARTDVSIPLPCGQTMTPPGIVASMLGMLGLTSGQRVLEIGCGTGYVSALMASLGTHVLSIERFGTLALAAHERLAGMGLRGVELQHADGLQPTRLLGRFDRIILNGAVEEVPEALIQRLNHGGRLVGGLRIDGHTWLAVINRTGDHAADVSVRQPVRLTPLSVGVAGIL